MGSKKCFFIFNLLVVNLRTSQIQILRPYFHEFQTTWHPTLEEGGIMTGWVGESENVRVGEVLMRGPIAEGTPLQLLDSSRRLKPSKNASCIGRVRLSGKPASLTILDRASNRFSGVMLAPGATSI